MSGPPSVAMLATAFYGPAALIAATFLLVRDVVPALRALVNGRIRTKGHSRRVIERATDPERFRAMVRRRLITGGTGFVFCAVSGLILIVRNIQFEQLMS